MQSEWEFIHWLLFALWYDLSVMTTTDVYDYDSISPNAAWLPNIKTVRWKLQIVQFK